MVIKNRQGCAPLDVTPSNASTNQKEPVKDDTGMWRPHYEDLNVPFLGVKTRARTFKRIEGTEPTSE